MQSIRLQMSRRILAHRNDGLAVGRRGRKTAARDCDYGVVAAEIAGPIAELSHCAAAGAG